jgi:hypothetical protein
MGSDLSFLAGVGLLGTLTALFIGFALAVTVLALLRMGDGKGANRISLIIVLCSFAIASGAWVFVLAVRNGLGLQAFQWYALAGFAIGLIGGLFPRLVGIPILTLAILAVFLGVSELSAWHRWQDDLPIVELKIYAADKDSSLCGLSLPDRNSIPVLQNLRLAPGPLVLEVDTLSIDGPLAFVFGSRHYRLASLRVDDTGAAVGMTGAAVGMTGAAGGMTGAAGGMTGAAGEAVAEAGRVADAAPAVHVFPFKRGILDGDGSGSPLMGYLGISRLRLRSVPLPAEDLAQGSYILESDGSLASRIR